MRSTVLPASRANRAYVRAALWLSILSLSCSPALSHNGWGIGVSPSIVFGGRPVIGSVSREWPGVFYTPAETFTLSSSHPSIVEVPAAVSLGDNVFQTTFPVNTFPVTAPVVVTITGMRGFETRQVLLTVVPLMLEKITLSSSRAVGEHTVTATVSLYGPAPSEGLVVALESTDRSVLTVPPTVTVPAGAESVSFPVSTSLRYEIRSATIKAAWNAVTVETSLTTVRPPRYMVEDVSPPGMPPATYVASAEAINEKGDVAGRYVDSFTYGFARLNGSTVSLDPTGGTSNWASDLNDSGQAVVSTAINQAFRWENGKYLDLGGLGTTRYGALATEARKINSAGAVVGRSFNGTAYHAFRYTDAVGMVDVAPDAAWGSAEAINDGGRIAGLARDGSGQPAYAFRTREDGSLDKFSLPGYEAYAVTMNNGNDIVVQYHLPYEFSGKILYYPDGSGPQELGLSDNPYATVTALNDIGVMVGMNVLPEHPSVPFVPFVRQPDGRIEQLNDLIDPQTGWVLGEPRDINNKGQIVGGGTLNGVARAYRLTPLRRSDVDRNGTVDIKDVADVLRIAAGLLPVPPEAVGDVAPMSIGDGVVDLRDAVCIARYLQGLDPGLP